MKQALKHRFTLRTAILTAVTALLLASAAAFIAVSAADEVSASDISPTDRPEVVASGTVSPSQMNEPPENLGDPVVTMTTGKAVGERLRLSITGENVYVDYGNGFLEEYSVHRVVQGPNIKVYGTVTVLYCDGNQLTSLDVSHNSALKYLNCLGNQLTTLDLSQNSALTFLDCSDNQLTSLDMSHNPALDCVYCSNNQLTTLDVSHNSILRNLSCGRNQLTSLDVSQNSALTFLDCSDNQLTALDVSYNPALVSLRCSHNQLTTLGVSHNPALVSLRCSHNQLTTLGVSHNPALVYLECFNNQLTSLDVSHNPALFTLFCNSNQLTSLKASNNPELTNLYCYFNRLTMPQIESYTQTVQKVKYAFQTHVIPDSVKVGDSIDLSSEYSVDGTVSGFTWYDEDGNVVAPATANGGVFTFGEDAAGKTLTCKMTNAKLPDFKVGTGSYEEYDNDGNPIGTIDYEYDNRLTTTAVKIEAADTTSSDDPTSSQDNGGHTIYYDLPYVENDDIDVMKASRYPEGTTVDVDGKVSELHSLEGVQLMVSNIDQDTKKSVLEAIARYNEAFDADTGNVALYDFSLENNNKVHVKVVNGEILICLKYPDNLAGQRENYVFHLYHQKADGTIEEIPVNCRPDGIWFTAKDFSPYVICLDDEKTAESVGTGESFTGMFAMTMLFMLSIGGAGYALYRRRKQTEA